MPKFKFCGGRQHKGFFLFPEVWYSLLEFNSRTICKHLPNWTRWNKREKFWCSANSLFKRRFRSCRRCCCLSSLIGDKGGLIAVCYRKLKACEWSHLEQKRMKLIHISVIYNHLMIYTRTDCWNWVSMNLFEWAAFVKSPNQCYLTVCTVQEAIVKNWRNFSLYSKLNWHHPKERKYSDTSRRCEPF